MSSWNAGGPIKPPRLGYYQKLPEGTFRQTAEPSTVVSAYYDMKSKYDPERYRGWIRLFLESTPCYLVFYTDASLAPFIEDCRKGKDDRTRVVILPREEWTANTAFPPGFWDKQNAIDPEKNIQSPELYKVWYEKKEFVKRAIALNPFGHSTYVWTDAGILRNPEIRDLVAKNFPVTERIPVDRMLLFNWWPYVLADEKDVVFPGNIRIKGPYAKPRVMAGILAGSKDAWERWYSLYDNCMQRFISAGLFVGKEQNIMGVVAIESKKDVSLLDVRKISPEPWFYLLLYLGVEEPLYKLFRSETAHRIKETYAGLLRRL
jgi:hypothetical protein